MERIPQLNGKTGIFEVTKSDRKGFIKVNPKYPYSFMYDDGTSFLWMGDTLWNDPGYTVFTQYIDLIKTNNYNVYHNYILDWNISRPNENGYPFEIINTTTRNLDRLRPEYHQAYEKRIMYANSKDIIHDFRTF